jgi:GH35 family endo-1,4-beta-xylanase
MRVRLAPLGSTSNFEHPTFKGDLRLRRFGELRDHRFSRAEAYRWHLRAFWKRFRIYSPMMSSRLALVMLWFTLAAILPARGDVASEQEARFRRLPAGTDVSPPRALEGMALALGKTNPAGIAEQVTVSDAPEFDKATRLLTRRVPEHPSGFQASARTVAEVKKNDLLLAVFWARATGASESAEAAFVFEPVAEEQARSVQYRFECEREWRRFFVPFLAAQDAPVGEAFLRFHLGYGPQVLEIGGLRLINYGNRIPLSEMPYTPLAYKGRRDDAPWRAEAAVSIEKERKAQFTIVVRNYKGKVVPWTEVRIRQLQPSYGFGAAIAPAQLLADTANGETFRWRLMDSFNQAELNTGLDWGATAQDRETALDAAQWLLDNDLQVRSHALFGAEGQLPADLASLRDKRAELRSKILDHVREKVSAAKDIITEWSVPIALSAESELGVALLGDVLRAAHDADPQARLLVHAGNVLVDGVDQAQQTAVINAIRSLLDNKAPVQGIALGSHSGEQLLPPDRIWAMLDRFAELRLPLTITDHEVDAWDEEALADYTRDFATAVFAHPSTVGCSIAAFWAKDHTVPNAALYTDQWVARPSMRTWNDLVQKKWATNTTVSTNGKGVAKIKAFLGYYAIEVRGGSKPKVVYARLGKNGSGSISPCRSPKSEPKAQ